MNNKENNLLKEWEQKRFNEAIKQSNYIWSNICYAKANLPERSKKPNIYSNVGVLIEVIEDLLEYISWKEEVYDTEILKLERRINKKEESDNEFGVSVTRTQKLSKEEG